LQSAIKKVPKKQANQQKEAELHNKIKQIEEEKLKLRHDKELLE